MLRPARSLLRGLLVRYSRGSLRRAEFDSRRVTFVLSSAWGMGGTIRSVHNRAGYLAPTHDVEILSLVRFREEAFFDLPPGVKVTAIDDLRDGAVPRPLRKVRNLLASKESMLLPVHDRPAEHASLWTDLQLVRRLRGRTGFLFGTRPGINFLLSELAPPGTITIGEEHLHLRAHSEETQALIRDRYSALEAVVVLTEADRRRFEEHLDGSVPVLAIPNTVRQAAAAAELSARRALAVGRLTEQKGFDLLVDAWANVASAHGDWTLRICGKGPLRKELRRQIARSGLGDSIELPGARDVAEQVRGASIFVLSSRYEGFPLVLLEAMSAGMAVIAFDCPTGPRELIRDRDNGLLVPDGDVAALAVGINAMIEDEELRRRCAEGAVETARRYTIEAIGPRWTALLEELGASREQAKSPDRAAGTPR
jgi:glycosyltransferase involved in cell wall biosynthesis